MKNGSKLRIKGEGQEGCFGGENGNGYTFAGFEPNSLVDMVRRAVADFHEETWNEKVEKVMSVDFSWKVSAKAYIAMYKKVLK